MPHRTGIAFKDCFLKNGFKTKPPVLAGICTPERKKSRFAIRRETGPETPENAYPRLPPPDRKSGRAKA